MTEIGSSPSTSTIRSEPWASRYCDPPLRVRRPIRFAKRVIGTIRRECLDWMIPLSQAHLQSILKSWVEHYNGGRPHSALGPGVPDPPVKPEVLPRVKTRHRLAADVLVLAKSI